MSEKAFPLSHKLPNPNQTHNEEGMDLRDYFAGKAIQGLLANPIIFKEKNGELFLHSSNFKTCYDIADRLIKERKKINHERRHNK